MPGRRAAEAVRREQIVKAAYEVASRKGLARLTIRQVASKARLSAGLVLFHFKTKDQLIVALLDWLLATTTVLHIGPDIQRIGPGAVSAGQQRPCLNVTSRYPPAGCYPGAQRLRPNPPHRSQGQPPPARWFPRCSERVPLVYKMGVPTVRATARANA